MSEYCDSELPGLDLDWFGVDRQGRVAQFASAGTNLVPEAVRKNREVNERLGDYLLAKEPRCGYLESESWKTWAELESVSAPAGSIESFVEFSRLGLYSYDCVYRGSVKPGGPYFKVTSPKGPISISDLPVWARGLVEAVFFDLAFEDTEVIDPAEWPSIFVSRP